MRNKEETELEQSNTELWDDFKYEPSASSTVISAQLNRKSEKSQGILAPFTLNQIMSTGYIEKRTNLCLMDCL